MQTYLKSQMSLVNKDSICVPGDKLFLSVIVCKVLVPGNTVTALLEQLESDTPYSVNVVALYADGEGSSVSDNGKTRESERRKPFVRCSWLILRTLCHL